MNAFQIFAGLALIIGLAVACQIIFGDSCSRRPHGQETVHDPGL
jgi:hypothetical protein